MDELSQSQRGMSAALEVAAQQALPMAGVKSTLIDRRAAKWLVSRSTVVDCLEILCLDAEMSKRVESGGISVWKAAKALGTRRYRIKARAQIAHSLKKLEARKGNTKINKVNRLRHRKLDRVQKIIAGWLQHCHLLGNVLTDCEELIIDSSPDAEILKIGKIKLTEASSKLEELYGNIKIESIVEG